MLVCCLFENTHLAKVVLAGSAPYHYHTICTHVFVYNSVYNSYTHFTVFGWGVSGIYIQIEIDGIAGWTDGVANDSCIDRDQAMWCWF